MGEYSSIQEKFVMSICSKKCRCSMCSVLRSCDDASLDASVRAANQVIFGKDRKDV